MDRKEAVMSKIKSCGGWPYGVSKIVVSINNIVYFDGCYIPNFITKGKWDGAWVDIVITENDYEKWKVNHACG